MRHSARRRSGFFRRFLSALILLAAGYAIGVSGVLASVLAMRIQRGPKPPTSVTAVQRLGPLPVAALLNVRPQDQYPKLPNGCEVTSLSMLLSAVGHPVSYLTLAKEQPYDPTKRIVQNGKVVFWGNPNVGFVGSVYQAGLGYAIYHGPLVRFLDRILPGRALDLTGKPFADIERVVADGTPVVLWTTTTFQPTNEWGLWNSPKGPVRFTPLDHTVLMVGYDRTQVFINNPLNGAKAEAIPIRPFLESWNQLGDQAITVKPAPKRS